MPKKFFSKFAVLLILTSWAIFPFWAKASVYISEIMYDVEGSDDKKEWVEIYNDSASEVNLKDWRFNDSANHILNEPPANGGRGSLVLPAYSYAILASDATTTIINYPSYSGIVIDTAMSLGNTSETLKIIDVNEAIIDTASYNSSMGANGDGKTLQKVSGSWIASVPTPGAANAESGSSSSGSALSSSSSQNSSSASSVANSGGGSIPWPDEPQIYANAGKDKMGIAGADVLFEGKALGIKKEPLENARYLWNFGDGSSGEGKNIKHTYKYPNNYIVVLDVSSGQYSVSDKTNVKITPNELIISEASDEFIKLKNKSGVILDISGWFLTGGGVLFKFPESSFISANSDLVISSDVSKIKFSDNTFSAGILYPNGSVAFSYSPTSASSSSKSKEIILSKLPEKKIEIAVGPVVSKKNFSNTSSNSNSSQNFTAEKNMASVITIGEKNNSRDKIWLILAVITGIIGGAGVFLARRKNQTTQN